MAFQSLKAVAIALSNNCDTEKVGKPLLTMLETAGNDFAKLTAGIESWYNSAMDRVSGWYKYRTQGILFAIGLVLAVLLNANTITIVRQLPTDATLRQSIAGAAKTAKPPESKSDQDLRNQYRQLGKEVAAVQNIGIPLGWAEGDSHHPLYYILGWLLTAIAISLGAPFWFDILNKFMVVRSTVKPREKSREEGSKDKVKT